MSFLKIKDPLKRDKLVAEYLKTKKKFKMIFSQNDEVNNHFTKILGKYSSQ